MPDLVRIPFTIRCDRSGEMTIEREEWDGMTRSERESYIEEMYGQEVANVMDGGWEIVNADLDDPTVED